jgi:hypothetical protein
MQLEDFKRWHWVLIAIVIGALMGFSWNLTPPDEKAEGRGISALDFVGNIARQKTGNGYSWIRQTLVYPAEDRTNPVTGKHEKANYVVCSMLTPIPLPADLDSESMDQLRGRAKDAGIENYEKMEKPQLLGSIRAKPKYKYAITHFSADIPFKVGNIQPKSDTYTIRDYLAETRTAFPDIDFKYAWWAAPRATYLLWTGGAVLLIGGVWPSLVGLIIGAGLGGPKREKKGEGYDLSRFGKSSAPSKSAAPMKPGVSEADAQQLRDLQEKLEQNVSGMAMTGGPAAYEGAPATATTVKQLSGSPDPIKPGAPTDSDEPKEYKGEYYPVVKAPTEPKKTDSKPVGR